MKYNICLICLLYVDVGLDVSDDDIDPMMF